jgi:hypothetical protein
VPVISIRVEGMDRVAERLRAGPLLGQPMRDAFNKIGLGLQTSARKRAPVDRGALRASIGYRMDPSPVPTWVRLEAGQAAPYAPYMEFGTGMQHDHPSWPRRPHRIPPGALDAWGKRKGIDGAAVAGAIMKRGGLKPRRFLRGALEENQDRVVRIIAGALRSAGGGNGAR